MSWKEGRRVVDLAVLAKNLHCKQCSELLDLDRTCKETQLGMASVLYIVCSCGLTNKVHTGTQQVLSGGKSAYTINVVASSSLLQCGVLAYVVQNFFSALSIPLPVPSVDGASLETSSSCNGPLDSIEGICEPEVSASADCFLPTADECSDNTSVSFEETSKAEDISALDEVKSEGENVDNNCTMNGRFQDKKLAKPEATAASHDRDIEDISNTELAWPQGEVIEGKSSEKVQIQKTAVIISTSSTDKPFGCGVCFKAYKTEETCRTHIQTHIGDKPFLCDECGKGFVCKYNLKLHMKQHTGERPHRCFLCGKGFIREFTLKRHMLRHKGHVAFTCEQCGEGFSSHESLKRHARLHTGEKPFQCDQCDKQFRGESNLYAHRRRHFGIKPYKCPDCGAAFVESTHLTRHRRTHTGEQPYVCEICGARYTQSGTLAAHRKKHTGEPRAVKVLQCADCGKLFHSYTQLKRHRRVHTGEKPYACEFCEAAFTQSSSLKAHRRIHTGERPYACDLCGQTFLYPRTLKRHKQKHVLEDAPFCLQP